jgi:hypothetical protein
MATQRAPSTAEAMWPTLRSNSPEAKAKEAQQARDRAWREQDRQRLVRGLRELRESLRADKLRRR